MSPDQEHGGGRGARPHAAHPPGTNRVQAATVDHHASDDWNGSSSVGSRDPRLADALDAYLEALKAGCPPPRAEFLGRYPDIAGALGHCLSGLELVHRAVGVLGAEADRDATGGAEGPPAARLGDYRIVGELGRGSMGVVYEAEQVSLGRRVALKVLPQASALDPRQRQRFLIEAQAAAQLHHPHIVPVFAAGCEQGVHFYAMRFVDGHSLAELVGELPDDPRAIARLGIQAAEALDHAHKLGVVHRDIKPANLLVDTRGALWVTDFGLAHCRTDLSLTRSGDLVGTLRYMSPEQALARRGVVDQRTDIYALGLTLYELLTRRPAFDGRDYQELLHQIAEEEPAPPRRLDPSMPLDLETIVLKAIRKNPSGRYATAQELADDLGRFCEGRPILARRPTPLERGLGWARRHRQLVLTALTVLVLGLAGVAVGVWLEARQTEAARKELLRHILVSFPAIDSLTITAMQKVTEATRGPAPDIKRAQMLEIYKKALHFYTEVSGLPPTDLESRIIVARAHLRKGFTHAVGSRAAGHMEDPGFTLAQADSHYREAIDRFEGLLKEAPRDLDVRIHFADALGEWGLGWLLDETQGPMAGEPYHRRALALRRALILEPGPEADVVAGEVVKFVQLSRGLAARLRAAGKAAEADSLHRDLVAVCSELGSRTRDPDLREALARPLGMYGSEMVVEDRLGEGIELLDLALLIAPDSRRSLNNLAWALVSNPAIPQSDPKRGLEVIRKALSLEPDQALLPSSWGLWNTQGVAAYRLGDWDTAIESLERSMDLHDGGEATDWFFMAMTRWRQGRQDEARRWFDRAVAWGRENQPQNHELLRFRAEAEALMGGRPR